MKLISRELANAFDANKPINFSLYFNKMLECSDNFTYDEQYGPYRQHNQFYEKSRNTIENVLKKRHIYQSSYCKAMELAGWRSFIVHARLVTPFVSGLGMIHPTETGLVLDHTSGVPYIPASSQKGMLRLAHLINSLRADDGNWKELNELLEQGVVWEDKDDSTGKIKGILWQEDDVSKTIFGFSEKKDALAGQLVVLDAYPLTPPELGEEILNPHFMKYYGGEQGPTEDQNPIPVKFLVVKPEAEFVFRLLLRLPFKKSPEKDQEKVFDAIKKNLARAITEEGMGAKTSLGFGRFSILNENEPSDVQGWLEKQEEEQKKEREQRLFPWRPFLKKIEAVADWGQLKQLMENSNILEYQANQEIGEALKNAAEKIRNNNAKKWNDERDNLVCEWLKPSGVDWECTNIGKMAEDNSITSEEQEIIDKIKGIKDWGAWKSANININNLPLTALKPLKERFHEWGCDNKNAKKDKIAAWKQLTSRIHKAG